MAGPGLVAAGGLVTVETFWSTHPGSSGPALWFPWEDNTTSAVRSEELPSPWGTVEDAARRARTWLLRSSGFGEVDIAIETLL